MIEFGLGKFGNGTGVYPPYVTGEPTETKITASIKAAIKRRYPEAFVRKMYSGGYMSAGLPDLYIAVDGHSIWIEVKRPNADTSATQKKTLEHLWSQGVMCGTADSADTAIKIIKEVVGV